MKCRLLALLTAMCILFSGCGAVEIEQEYELYGSSVKYGLLPDKDDGVGAFYSQDKCIGTERDVGDEDFSEASEGYGLFDDTSRDVISAHNLYEKLYPASTTKIMTAYTALKHGDLKQVYTVSESAISSTAGTSVAGLRVGDKLTLSDLLYALMLPSGNDAAVVIAEGVGGDVSSFADLMNEEAQRIGAVHSHFVNPHGLHDDMHYTCVYDMYLIFHEALKDPTFAKVIKKAKKKIKVTHSDGNTESVSLSTTNMYLNGGVSTPKGITVYGGKTGTTNAAGYCLVNYAKIKKTKHKIICIVFKAESRPSLYSTMSSMMTLAK